jgi:hypothetical protein
METNNINNTILITMPIFGVREENGKKMIHHASIINYGKKMGGGMIEYVTSRGKAIESIHSLPHGVKVFELEEICLDNLMSKWKRINKEYGKKIILDETINTNEVYVCDFSPLRLMIDRREDCIAIKPVFE